VLSKINIRTARRYLRAEPLPRFVVSAGGLHSLKQGKVDSLNGRRGMVVSLDIEEYERAVGLFGFARIPGDDGPGELVQSFDQGMCWNVRWTRTGVSPASRCGSRSARVGRRSGRARDLNVD